MAWVYLWLLFGFSLLLFFGVIQPFVMTSLLKIPQAEQGGITGKLGVLNELTLLILTPLFGIISDRIGRKPVFVFGFFAIGVAAILYTFLDSVNLLFAFRISAAVGSAAISGMFSTVIADYVINRDRGKATGLMGFFNGLGAMLAVLVLLNLPSVFVKRGNEFDAALILTFYVVSGIALASSVVLMVGLKRGLASANSEQKSFVSLAKEGLFAAKDPRILLAYTAAFVSRGDLALVGSFLTLWLNKYGIQSGMADADAAKQVGLGIVIVQSIALLAAPVVGLMADRLHAVAAVTIAAFIAAVGYGSLFLIENPFGNKCEFRPRGSRIGRYSGGNHVSSSDREIRSGRDSGLGYRLFRPVRSGRHNDGIWCWRVFVRSLARIGSVFVVRDIWAFCCWFRPLGSCLEQSEVRYENCSHHGQHTRDRIWHGRRVPKTRVQGCRLGPNHGSCRESGRFPVGEARRFKYLRCSVRCDRS